MITVPLIDPQPFILDDDEALDSAHESFNYEQYSKTLDRAHLPVKAGGEPTVFWLKPLSRRAFNSVHALLKSGAEAEAWSEAVAYGLMRVENFRARGVPVALKTHVVGGLERLTDATLDAIFRPGLFFKLGSRVLQLSMLDP